MAINIDYNSVMKGDVLLINGSNWMVVDVAPAPELAEMVAVILDEEGFPVMVKGHDALTDALSSLGVASLGTTLVLVPESRGEAALKLIAETVTDYEGEDIDAVLEQLALEASDSEVEG